MSTMYIACNNALPRGYFLGDVLTIIKAAWLFVENEPHDEVVLSLHDRDPLNFFWDRFVAENLVTVVHDRWDQASRATQYEIFDERRRARCVRQIAFDTYKELYARIDGGERQVRLCGSEKGLIARSIFQYYYLGQETGSPAPRGTRSFARGLIEKPDIVPVTGRSVFVAPHEKCHGNAVFTHAFWEQTIRRLLQAGIEVTVNDDRGFLRAAEGPLLKRTFLPFRPLVSQVAAQRLVLSGNTGIGWLAGALGTPLIALERIAAFAEFGFERCGVESLVESIDEPDVERVAAAVERYFDAREARSATS